MPLLGFSVFIDQVEKGLNYKGDYWKLVEKWKIIEDIQPSPIGIKCQTIRAIRHLKGKPHLIKRGDKLYLYTGLRTKKCRKLGEAICSDAFMIGMDVYPEDLRPYPFGKTEMWQCHEPFAEGGPRIDIEELAQLDGFNKYPTEYGIYTAEMIEKYKGFFETYTPGSLPEAGVDKYILPEQYKNALDMVAWFSKVHGNGKGVMKNCFFQVIRWQPPSFANQRIIEVEKK